MSLRLVEAKLGTLYLDENHGVRVESLDVSHPTVRLQVADRVAANGVDDTSQFYGSRTVGLTLHVFEEGGATRSGTLDMLRAFASPARRPWLYLDLDDTGEWRRIRLRGNDLGAPITLPGYAAVNVGFSAPEGIFEAANAVTVRVDSSVSGEAGRAYPKSYPVAYPKASFVGANSVVNPGTEPAIPVYRLWGPCVNPKLVNLDTNEFVTFTGLTLTDTQYAEVDAAATTAYLNGRLTESVYGKLDLLRTDFGFIPAGLNRFRYVPDSYDAGAHAEIVFRPSWL